MIEFSEVIKQGAGTLLLTVSDPSVSGTQAGKGTFARGTDNSVWCKYGEDNTEWVRIDVIDRDTEKVKTALLPTILTSEEIDIDFQARSEKGDIGGYAPLDNNKQIPPEHFPPFFVTGGNGISQIIGADILSGG